MSCTSSSQSPESGTYSGYYVYGFETSLFVAKGSKEHWWLVGSAPCEEPYKGMDPTPILYLEIQGKLGPKGKHGHMGTYSRELTPEKFITCRKLLPGEQATF